jgi:hypothetical protein
MAWSLGRAEHSHRNKHALGWGGGQTTRAGVGPLVRTFYIIFSVLKNKCSGPISSEMYYNRGMTLRLSPTAASHGGRTQLPCHTVVKRLLRRLPVERGGSDQESQPPFHTIVVVNRRSTVVSFFKFVNVSFSIYFSLVCD